MLRIAIDGENLILDAGGKAGTLSVPIRPGDILHGAVTLEVDVNTTLPVVDIEHLGAHR